MDTVLRLAVRCNLVGCSQWMVAGRLSSVGTWSVECVVLAPDPVVQACQSLVACFIHSIDDRPRVLVDSVLALWRR